MGTVPPMPPPRPRPGTNEKWAKCVTCLSDYVAWDGERRHNCPRGCFGAPTTAFDYERCKTKDGGKAIAFEYQQDGPVDVLHDYPGPDGTQYVIRFPAGRIRVYFAGGLRNLPPKTRKVSVDDIRGPQSFRQDHDRDQCLYADKVIIAALKAAGITEIEVEE